MWFGEYRIEIIPDTEFWLDGGAMFGVVPRTLWSRVFPPDDLNRVRLNMNCLFIEAGGERILIDTGIGEKWTPKQTAIYGIQRQRSLVDSLHVIAGCVPEEITIVVNTHLHFDHAGGNTKLNELGQPVPTFPRARYLVSRAEWEHAESPSERDRASYLPENWKPLEAAGQLELMPAEYEVVAGLRMETQLGHNHSTQCPRLTSGTGTLFGFADIVPTTAHIPPAWIMGFDLYPMETLETKKRLLPQAAREGWLCLFYHQPEAQLYRLVQSERNLTAVPLKEEHL